MLIISKKNTILNSREIAMDFLKSFVIFFNINLVFSANILAIFQYPFYSHQFTYHKLMKQLLLRGHNLTIFTSHLFNYDNFSNVIQHHFTDSLKISNRNTNMLEYKQKNLNWFQIDQRELKTFYETTKSEILHPEMQKIIKNNEGQKFDLIIIECCFCHLIFLAEIYDCPVIYFGASDVSFVWHGLMGNDVNPALYSDFQLIPFLHRYLTFFERVQSLFRTFIIILKTAFITMDDENKKENTFQIFQ
ncbi:hypothetical protein PVAND_016772 [Polypedilum vanderplanki]|uniref:Glucuronosyltransferase n=1 Tax=Polypedilum vanderplanki TaxID=319348 RepID=A0A9J6BGM0_POLVA|nr:hypothetical protein PVAND_016772 [Polypedilum vanderplanki]